MNATDEVASSRLMLSNVFIIFGTRLEQYNNKFVHTKRAVCKLAVDCVNQSSWDRMSAVICILYCGKHRLYECIYVKYTMESHLLFQCFVQLSGYTVCYLVRLMQLVRRLKFAESENLRFGNDTGQH